MKNHIALALILILSLILTCCPLALADAAPADAAAPESVEAVAPEPTVAPLPALDVVLATVNGQDVTYTQVGKYYEGMVQQYSQMLDLSDPKIDSLLRSAAVNYAATEAVILQKAGELGLDNFGDQEKDDFRQQAEAQFNSVAEQYKQMFMTDTNTDEEQLAASQAFLASNGYTVDTLYEQLVNGQLYQRVLADVTKDLSVSDEQVRAEYDGSVEAAKAAYEANITQYDTDAMSGAPIYYVPEGVRAVKHILIKIDTGLAAEIQSVRDQLAGIAEGDEARVELQTQLDALMADVQPRLDEVQAKIEAGEDFQGLIDEYGEDPGMQEGSSYKDTGYYLNASTVVFEQPFAQAAMALEAVGDISEPVLGTRGFHIVRYDHDVASGPVDFELVKDSLRETALNAARQQAESDAVEGWVKDADVVMFLDRFGVAIDETGAVEAAPLEEAPAEEAAVEEAPIEETPIEETPAEEAPVEEVAPAEEAQP